ALLAAADHLVPPRQRVAQPDARPRDVAHNSHVRAAVEAKRLEVARQVDVQHLDPQAVALWQEAGAEALQVLLDVALHLGPFPRAGERARIRGVRVLL